MIFYFIFGTNVCISHFLSVYLRSRTIQIIKYMATHHKHSLPVLAWLIVAMAMIVPSLSSCGNDEPDLLIGYYMTIQSKVRLNLSEMEESQGTSSQPEADVLSQTIVRMRHALHEVYTHPSPQGNDAVVISALDYIYNEYHSMYSSIEKNTVCVVKLYRARIDDEGIVKKSTPLKSYHFGAQPPSTE